MNFPNVTILSLSLAMTILGLSLITQPFHGQFQNIANRQLTFSKQTVKYGIFSLSSILDITFLKLVFHTLNLTKLLLIGSGAAWLTTSVLEHLSINWGGKRRSRNLDFALIAFLEQIHQRMVSGDSLYKSLGITSDLGNRDIAYLQGLIRSGLDSQSCIKFWLEDFETASKHRLVDIWSGHSSTAETLNLIQNSIVWLRNEHKFYLISEIERRNQLVWIPVTIAVLIPGMLFIAIPLESTLKSILS